MFILSIIIHSRARLHACVQIHLFVYIESGRGPAEGSAYETAMKMTINTETCFELNQQNAKLICRACGNETNTDSGVTWCMTPGTGRPVCGSNSETFHKEGNGYEEVYVTSEDDLLLSTVRNLHESIAFNCTRVCTDGESQEHKTKVTVESMYHQHNVLLLVSCLCYEY